MSDDFKAKLAAAKLPRRTLNLCLRGDLVAEFEELERQLETAQNSGNANLHSIEDEPDTLRIARRIEALQAEMQESTYTFVLEALPGPKYRELKAQHPPREDDNGEIRSEDQILDANYDTFIEPLARACIVDPVLDDATWAELDSKLSDSQYNALMTLAVYVNKGRVDVPFSRAASRLLRSNENE